MDQRLAAKAEQFRDLHEQDGLFLMPNAWNAGSARLLAAGGFPALATTSAGIAFSLGRPDYEGRVTRDEMMAEIGRIAEAVTLPVSADTEAGYGPKPEQVAETVRQTIAADAVGGSIEDFTGDRAAPLFDIELSVERIRAAREAADGSGVAFTLTARAECYLVGHPEPYAESVMRLNRYRAAGADCLYAPGPRDAETIGALVRDVDGPVNVVVGLSAPGPSLTELQDLGVKRVSIGGSLARASLAVVRRAAQTMAETGSFDFALDAIPDAEMNRFLGSFDKGTA